MAVTLDDAKQKHLQSLLSRLSFPIAAKLLSAIELDRLSGDTELPHDVLIDFIRPTVAANKQDVPRTATPQRLFCQPFEDLLYIGRLPQKEMGRISRETLNPMWSWVTRELMPEEAQKLCAEITRAIVAQDADGVHTALSALHREASQAMKDALGRVEDDGRAAKELSKKLGGAGSLEDVQEIATILEFGPEIMEVQARYPRPVEHMTNEDLFDFRNHYTVFCEHMPEMTGYLMLIMMGRLSRPWDMMGVVSFLTQAEDDSAVSDTADAGVVGDSLLRDAERFANYFQRPEAARDPAAETLVNLEQFTELVQGIIAELGIRKDGEWGQRIFKCRQIVSDAMARILDDAVAAVEGALPVRVGGSPSAIVSPRPELDATPDDEPFARAMDGALLISGARHLAAKAAFASAQSEAQEKAAKIARAYALDMIEEIRAAEGPEKDAALVIMNRVVSVARMLVGEEDAELLQRRANAAARAA